MVSLSKLRCIAADCSGVAATEAAILLSFLAIVSLNGVELARWAYTRMQVANAAQMAVAAAYKACDTKHLPATINCPDLGAAISRSLASTSLGSAVQQDAGSPVDGYYCINTSGAFVASGTLATHPADCSAVGDATHAPANYLTVNVTMAYTPLASAVTIGSLLPARIKASSTMRMQ